MKKLVIGVVIMLMALVGSVYGAGETGEGEATISPDAIFTGEALTYGRVYLTFTAKTTNMVEGVVYVRIPNSLWAPASAAAVVKAGDATEIGPVLRWQDLTYTYVGATITADINQEVGFNWALATAPNTAGSLTWTVYSATDAATTYTAEAITTSPITVVTSSNKSVSVASQGPQPATTPLLTTDTDDVFTWILNLDTNYKLGNVRIEKPVGAYGYWADFSTNSTAAGYVAITGAGGTPTVQPNFINIPVAAATAGQDITIKYGDGTTVKSTRAGIPAIFPVKGNSISTAATETPVATSVTYNVWVQVTPTVVITPLGYSSGRAYYTSNNINYLDDKRVYVNDVAGQPVSKSGTRFDVEVPVGKSNITIVQKWYDNLNDGKYRSVTSNADTVVNLGDWTEKKINMANGLGLFKTLYIAGDSTLDIPYQAKVSDTADAIVFEIKQMLDEEVYADVMENSGAAMASKFANTANSLTLVSPDNAMFVSADYYIAISSPALADEHINTFTVKYILLPDWLKAEGF